MRSLSRLNKYFFKYKYRLLLGVLFVTVSNLFGIMPAKLIREAIDSTARDIEVFRLTQGWDAADTITETISYNLLVFASLVLLMALLKGLFMFLMRQTIIIVSRYIEFDLKNEVYDHYQKLDFNFYNRNSTGDLMNRISEDVGRVRMYVGPALMYTVNLVVMFILVIYAMIQVDLKLTLITLLPLPLLSVLIYKVEDVINQRSERVQRKLSDVSTMAQESFSGIRVLKAYAMEKPASDKFGDLANDYAQESIGLVKVNAMFQPSLVMLVGLSTILTVYFGGLEVTRGNLTMGNVAEFILYVNMLTWPVASLGWVVSLVQRAAASQERLNEFLDTDPAVKPGHVNVNKLRGEVEFSKVTYKYPGAAVNTVENITFKVSSGTSVAITGKTGSGKSTLAALLTRMFDPDSGMIKMDGVVLKDYDTGSLNSRIGVVPQESFLFSDTIENNIAFGVPSGRHDASQLPEKIRLAASRAAVLENILGFPAGMKTKVGERGITLSGGQKQRISIARALMHEPDILVLDDCLSAVDTGTEEEIIRNIREVMHGKTTFWISHRISSISHADLILVMDNGKVVESGTHEELIRHGGLYRDLYHQQALEGQSRPE